MPIPADMRNQVSESLRKAALNEEAKNYLLHNPVLFNVLLKAARRYIGGQTLQEALETRKSVEAQGFMTSLEFMGENVTTTAEAKEATQEFLRIIEAVKAHGKPSRVSLDLSHLGFFLDYERGVDNFRLLAEASKDSQIDLIISAEGMDRTQDILDAYLMFSEDYPHVGITLQAYLHRTKNDLVSVLENSRGKVRIVKGAFDGPKELFLSRGPALDDRYVDLVATILDAGRYCSIATHDIQLLNRIVPILKQHNVSSSLYEFEMLYGINNEALMDFKQQGYPCRIYIVYGKEWYLYLCNRLAENPEDVFRALVDILR